MYGGLRAIVALEVYVRTTSRCVRLRQQLWPLMTGNGCATYTPQHAHNSQAILIMREYRNLQPQPHYIPNLDRFVNPTTKTDRDRPPQLFSKKCKITQTREK